jgi:hypothetical protein
MYVDANGVDFVGLADAADEPMFNFSYTPLEYDNYDVDKFGNLDLTKPSWMSKKGERVLKKLTLVDKKQPYPPQQGGE